ncbi:MAG: transketolase [Deltaproteobacteria bacterium]|nr:transketolase [Deltaproteobacteria bacterium]
MIPNSSVPASNPSAVARSIRKSLLRMVHHANASHVGGGLSIADVLAHLYGGVLRVDPSRPNDPERDRLILSKGHTAAALYATLAERGFFPSEWLDHYGEEHSPLTGHTNHLVPGVDASTGALGHGLSLGCGIALAMQRDRRPARAFVVLSDGELDEGSTWEAALFAGHHQLEGLIAIVDYNQIQSFGNVCEILDLEPLADKWRAFRWQVVEIDGHDHDQIAGALARLPAKAGSPTVILARTVKGKGVSFMEGELLWHYRSPDGAQLERALRELDDSP